MLFFLVFLFFDFFGFWYFGLMSFLIVQFFFAFDLYGLGGQMLWTNLFVQQQPIELLIELLQFLLFVQFRRALRWVFHSSLININPTTLIKSHNGIIIFMLQYQPNSFTQHPQPPLITQVHHTLAHASQLLPHAAFQNLLSQIAKKMISKAQIESLSVRNNIFESLQKLIETYGGGLELHVRTLLLQIDLALSSKAGEDIQDKFQKSKHMLIHTQWQYLLGRVFLLQERWCLGGGDQHGAFRCLKKCLQLNEQHSLQCLSRSQEVRRELADTAILAYYECFRLRKNEKRGQALEHLLRACNAAVKNYGKNNDVTRGLHELYNRQENASTSFQRMSSHSQAMTEIISHPASENYRAAAYYNWEEERIVAQLTRLKPRRQVVSEISYDVKLDINKVKLLRGGEWLFVQRGHVQINEDELLRVLGVNTPLKEMTTRIQMRNVSREQIVKKDNSSSSDHSDFFQKEEFKFMKLGRTQSSKKYKETH